MSQPRKLTALFIYVSKKKLFNRRFNYFLFVCCAAVAVFMRVELAKHPEHGVFFFLIFQQTRSIINFHFFFLRIGGYYIWFSFTRCK
jgi:hypothetical protein